MATRQRRSGVPAIRWQLLPLLALLLLVPLCQGRIQKLESTTWHPPAQAAAANPAAGTAEQQACETRMLQGIRLLRKHPAVHTLQDLGIWSTQHFGRLPASVAASAALAAQPEGTGVARKLISGVWAAMKATVPHGGSPAVLLRHWWRLRCNDADAQSSQLTAPGNGTSRQVTSASGHTSSSSVGTMDLRGLGTATVSLDWVYHHTLTPWLPVSTTAIIITEQNSSSGSSSSAVASANSWTLPQSEVVPGIPSGWHIEGRGLSQGRLYSLTPQHSLSNHAHSLDASQCSDAPMALKPGTLWSVITASEPYQDLDLYAKLVAEHTSYHQQLGFTGAILMVTRAVAAQLLMHPALQQGLEDGTYFIILWDGDVVPGTPYYHQSLWHNLVLLATWGIPGIKLAFIDLDEFYVLPKHKSFQDAFRDGNCLASFAQARITRLSAFYGLTAAQAAACPDTRFFHKACQPVRERGDIAELAKRGWKGFFTQPSQYIDARPTIPESPWYMPHRWAHKSFVDPNYIAAYSIHEGSLVLPGGGVDSQHGVPLECAFGLHMVNMMAPRMYGNGEELRLNGTRFDMPNYVQTRLGQS